MKPSKRKLGMITRAEQIELTSLAAHLCAVQGLSPARAANLAAKQLGLTAKALTPHQHQHQHQYQRQPHVGSSVAGIDQFDGHPIESEARQRPIVDSTALVAETRTGKTVTAGKSRSLPTGRQADTADQETATTGRGKTNRLGPAVSALPIGDEPPVIVRKVLSATRRRPQVGLADSAARDTAKPAAQPVGSGTMTTGQANVRRAKIPSVVEAEEVTRTKRDVDGVSDAMSPSASGAAVQASAVKLKTRTKAPASIVRKTDSGPEGSVKRSGLSEKPSDSSQPDKRPESRKSVEKSKVQVSQCPRIGA
ncbi:unnamed protein product [Protopolystoma xenopodis]|uniref:Uncharacterized protein n=1 Tax=Protopolystoma xenopodis TaxID=117903 RepID=A0A3S5A4E3_9PLAT|nr:unnamed protein product [Protopolystoma xenopodis]